MCFFPVSFWAQTADSPVHQKDSLKTFPDTVLAVSVKLLDSARPVAEKPLFILKNKLLWQWKQKKPDQTIPSFM
jgi:hypothetical protein